LGGGEDGKSDKECAFLLRAGEERARQEMDIDQLGAVIERFLREGEAVGVISSRKKLTKEQLQKERGGGVRGSNPKSSNIPGEGTFGGGK